MKRFEVQFLSKQEMRDAHKMDRRYRHVDDDNLGFSDPVKGRVFVLASKDKELTQYLIQHEVEHLFEEKGTHEDENGIRHKKGGILNVLQHFINPLNFGGMGPLSNDKKGFADTSREGAFNSVAGPVSSALGNAATGFLTGGPIGAGVGALHGLTSYDTQKPQGQSQQGGINSIFPSSSNFGANQGFGQQGAPGASSMGGQGGIGAPTANMGLGAGLPNQAGISMGQGAQGGEQQNQAGYFRPTYKF